MRQDDTLGKKEKNLAKLEHVQQRSHGWDLH